jgi:hypothetical protein
MVRGLTAVMMYMMITKRNHTQITSPEKKGYWDLPIAPDAIATKTIKNYYYIASQNHTSLVILRLIIASLLFFKFTAEISAEGPKKPMNDPKNRFLAVTCGRNYMTPCNLN